MCFSLGPLGRQTYGPDGHGHGIGYGYGYHSHPRPVMVTRDGCPPTSGYSTSAAGGHFGYGGGFSPVRSRTHSSHSRAGGYSGVSAYTGHGHGYAHGYGHGPGHGYGHGHHHYH